jgi:hypothetical protein
MAGNGDAESGENHRNGDSLTTGEEMNIRNEIDLFASDTDKSVLHWLFDKYHMASQWAFVARCEHQRYGALSYETNRVWIPTEEGRALHAQMCGVTELINRHGLLVRPSLCGHWRAGLWQGVTGDGKAYCCSDSEVEAPTLEQAVLRAAEKLTHNTETVRVDATGGQSERMES